MPIANHLLEVLTNEHGQMAVGLCAITQLARGIATPGPERAVRLQRQGVAIGTGDLWHGGLAGERQQGQGK